MKKESLNHPIFAVCGIRTGAQSLQMPICRPFNPLFKVIDKTKSKTNSYLNTSFTWVIKRAKKSSKGMHKITIQLLIKSPAPSNIFNLTTGHTQQNSAP